MNYEPKVALMFGGASGLAQLSAIRWASQGGLAIAIDIDAAGLKNTAAAHPNVETMQVDVCDAAAVLEAVQLAENRFGPVCRVDNAAAIFPTNLALKMDAETFAQVMRVNFLGMVNVSLACLPPMLSRSRGALVNYCSIAGLIPYMHLAAYSASKSACVAFTETLYHENRKRGVDIVCLCPPAVKDCRFCRSERWDKSLGGLSGRSLLSSCRASFIRAVWCLKNGRRDGNLFCNPNDIVLVGGHFTDGLQQSDFRTTGSIGKGSFPHGSASWRNSRLFTRTK